VSGDDLSPIYYRVSPVIWRQTWSEDARLLAMYILTSPHRTIEGLFVLPRPYICGDMKWSPERLDKPFAELLADGFIQYDEDGQVCLIVKALEYQAPANPNMCISAVRRIKMVPASSLDEPFLVSAIRKSQPLAELLAKQLPKRFGKSLALALTQLYLNSECGRGREASPGAPPAPAKSGYCQCGAALQHNGDGTENLHCPVCETEAVA